MSVITSLNLEERCLDANASLCTECPLHIRWDLLYECLKSFSHSCRGFCTFTAKTPTQLSHFIPLSIRKHNRIWNSSSAVALSLAFSQKSRSSCRDFVMSTRTWAINIAFNLCCCEWFQQIVWQNVFLWVDQPAFREDHHQCNLWMWQRFSWRGIFIFARSIFQHDKDHAQYCREYQLLY